MNWRGHWRATWPVLLLCCLTGSRWLFEQVDSSVKSTAPSRALGCGLAAAITFGLARALKSWKETSAPFRHSWRSTWAGGLLLAVVGLGSAVSDRRIHGTDETLALALSPIVIVVMGGVLGDDVDLTRRLPPVLAGVAGLLLLLPEPELGPLRYDLALVLTCVATGFSASFAAEGNVQESDGVSGGQDLIFRQLAMGTVLLGGLWLAQAERVTGFRVSPLAVGMDGLTAWLMLFALQRAGASRFSASFLLSPLLTLLEGVALERPALDLRSWIAFGFLVWGVLGLLFARPEASSSPLLAGSTSGS